MLDQVRTKTLTHAAAALVLATMAIACSDAVCPSGTTEQRGHCIPKDDLDASTPTGITGTAGEQASTASDTSTVPQESRGGSGSGSPAAAGAGGERSVGSAGIGGGSAGVSGAGSSAVIDGAGAPSQAGHQAPSSPEPECGNGVREGVELCDGDCVSRCDTMNACLVSTLTGAAATCDAQCSDPTEITQCKSGDGCCAKGCTHANDTDCSKSCGDGTVDAPELCEPTSTSKPCPTDCDDHDPCTQDIKTGTPEQCNVACQSTKITSPRSGDGCCPSGANANNDQDCKPTCGNGVLEPGEDCEGSSCANFCDDHNPCTADRPIAGANKCQVTCENKSSVTAETCDGIDNDCDGVIDNNAGDYWFPDCDGDGYAPQTTGIRSCKAPASMAGCKWITRAPGSGSTDCDDKLSARHPGADFGLPSSAGAGLPPARDWAYDLNCDGTQEATTDHMVLQDSRASIQMCSSATPSCSSNCVTSVSFFGELVCGQPYTVGTACGDAPVLFLCR